MDNLLGRLRKAVKKVTFLLNFNINSWRLASMMGRTSSTKRRVSFNDRPGLRSCTDIIDTESEDSNSLRGLQRTTSYSSPVSKISYEDDIDNRAEAFISNFYRQLQIERQISLELQYYRGNSFKLISP